MAEFRSEMTLNVKNLPIPFKKPVLVEKLFVKGIEDDKYSILNNHYVVKRKQNSMKRNLYKNNGEVRGETNYTAKEGNLLVVTQDNLRLPFKYEPTDNRLEYVDFQVNQGVRSFIYSVPKEYLYRTQQTALILCQNQKKSHYGGMQITLTNGHSIYLYITSLRSIRETEGNIALVTKVGIDYTKELAFLQKKWLEKGIIFPREALELEHVVNDTTNLGYKTFQSTMDFKGVDDFNLKEREEMRKKSAY